MKKIMVIDDSKVQVSIIANILTKRGNFSVVGYTNSVQAAEEISINHAKYHGILLDLNMPEVDGISVLKLLEKIHFQGGVILISGLGEKLLKVAKILSKRRKLHLLGALAKPVDETALCELLNRNIDFQSSLRRDEALGKQQITRAIEQNYLLPYFQPQVYVDGKIHGFEMLARIDLPEKGVITPNNFIPQAESFGLLPQLFPPLLSHALKGAQELGEHFGHNEFSISVNVSTSQLEEEGFTEILTSAMSEFDLSPRQLTIEITESQAMKSNAEVLENMSRIRLAGFKISIDDFGTGFSNIDTLTQLPFDEVKLDRSFANGVAEDKVSQIIVESLVRIVREVDAKLIVEGVERKDDLDFLHRAGCEVYQGFIFCRPKPLCEVVRWLDVALRYS